MIFFLSLFNNIDEKIIQLIGKGMLYYIINTIIILLISILIGKILKFLLRKIGKQISKKTTTTLDDRIIDVLLSHDVSISLIIGTYFSVQSIAETLPKRSTFYRTFDFADKILLSLLTIVIATALVRGINLLTRQSMIATAAKNKTSFDRAQSLLIKRVVTFFASSISIIIILDLFGQNITSLLTILGIGSLAIGLASQDTIANIISGYTIMLDHPFRLGDRIKLQSGEEGDVYEIGVRSTKILDFDNNLIVVPNSELVKTRIINYSAPHEETRVVVDFTLAFDTDSRHAKELLSQVLKNEKELLVKPEPEIFLVKLSENGLQFRIVGRVATVKNQIKVADRLRYEVYELMRANDIKFAAPKIVK